MLYKGGFVNELSNGTVIYCAGDESSAYGTRPAQYPLEVEIQKDGVSVGVRVVVENDEAANGVCDVVKKYGVKALTDCITHEVVFNKIEGLWEKLGKR